VLNEIVRVIRNSTKGAVLTGAGISAESGVPTFRGKEGLWGKFRPEDLATMEAFLANSKVVWEWYNWRRELMGKVKPNPGHYALVQLSEYFKRFTLITQNVDNLHRVAGAADVLELHGNIYRNKCAECGRPWQDETQINPDNLPCCLQCGGKIRPDVVWFGELLPEEVVDRAFREAAECEVFFSIGTSALVHPAADLPILAKQNGATLVEINPERTPLSHYADYYLEGKAGEILPALMNLLKETAAAK
jgi:NAD-dependent deacetylase